ncbi:MAG: hypothetical protein CM1200mP35_01880 [Chloroflexota bacterium]|nr:MAG: hypothetical protein CM1200mP35_01880 [Chloroflexota bacterium]
MPLQYLFGVHLEGKSFPGEQSFADTLGASLFTALAMLFGKYALEELPVWFVYSIRNFGMGLVFVFLWRPGSFRILFRALRSWQTFLILFLAEFSLAPLAVLMNVTAISLGPVSLVSTIQVPAQFLFSYLVLS